MDNQVASQAFWESEWQAAIDLSRTNFPEKERNPGQMTRWNKMAKDFAERTDKQKATQLRDKTIRFLVDRKILTPKTRVLDIGAGPGAWALPMSRHCAHVTALEPARSMTDIIAGRMEEEKVDNITIDPHTWQEVDHVESLCPDGEYRPEKPVCRGAMIWSVHKDDPMFTRPPLQSPANPSPSFGSH